LRDQTNQRESCAEPRFQVSFEKALHEHEGDKDYEDKVDDGFRVVFEAMIQ